jgi:hypothetical protein
MAITQAPVLKPMQRPFLCFILATQGIIAAKWCVLGGDDPGKEKEKSSTTWWRRARLVFVCLIQGSFV